MIKHFLLISFLFIGCRDAPKENHELNRELQETKAELQRLEILNDSLSEQLEKCDNWVKMLESD